MKPAPSRLKPASLPKGHERAPSEPWEKAHRAEGVM